jgi:hypothetical protein
MRSTELTREQLERIEREVERQRNYYLKLWRRAQANDSPLAKSTKTSGLAEVELPWAEHQRRMAEACRAEREKPRPPKPKQVP